MKKNFFAVAGSILAIVAGLVGAGISYGCLQNTVQSIATGLIKLEKQVAENTEKTDRTLGKMDILLDLYSKNPPEDVALCQRKTD